MLTVFLDANVLAKPFTRTLLWAGAALSEYRVVWSPHAEQEAERHMGSRATAVAVLRARHGLDLSRPGTEADSYRSTEAKDRQILADAVAAGARFLITENVADFGLADVERVEISAVHPDLFLAYRLSRSGYAEALVALSANMRNPARTPEVVHAATARQHPLLFAAHADVYEVDPQPTSDDAPRVAFRGVRCVRCSRILKDPESRRTGLGAECRIAKRT